MYQAAVGTSIITAANGAGSACYEFGEYNAECGKWNSPFVENNALPSWIYSSRTPTLTDIETRYPTFSHVFLPVSAQFLAWMLGSPADSDPEVIITALVAKMTYPLTIRHQLEGGSAPQNKQAVDCYCIGLTMTMERGRKMLVAPEFAWGALEDIGDNPNVDNGIPVAPAALMTGVYNGNPDVTWNVTSLTGVWRADVRCAQEYDIVSSNEGTKQTVYTGKMKPVQMILSAVLKQNTSWDDYVGRTARTMTITVKKFDDTSYITLTFTNVRVVNVRETGHRNKGHYGASMALIAEKVEGESDWFTEHGAAPTFADHWKAAI